FGRLFAQMIALAAFTDLKTLKGFDESTTQKGFELEFTLPIDFQPMRPVMFEVVEPIFHSDLRWLRLSLSRGCRMRTSKSKSGAASSNRAIINSGQLNWVGKSFLNASMPPPATRIESAIKT